MAESCEHQVGHRVLATLCTASKPITNSPPADPADWDLLAREAVEH